eukprot:TRINITY_DN18619_c0_g1::TRINITY_DN18619_c0_g1_i1::g.1072::m.1072 TRINITY_DN18619_c0_g1::TRINITY_DN18619_c0_g1_i1::g.1072  ORF type:complete len:375 (+),score=40.74,sp/Q55CU8/RSC5_DICDI/25.74/5e-19,CRAL_TRIO/PF00650.15/3.5e-27,CRAL_TRIO_N/PF03765.10/6.5e-05,CRAL_TRIO_N/PF03765.10/4.7e+03,CRAL_TRIO_2/PF13716.1/1.6e+03,CRAL_TRIO_2/PF13716.1/0.024,Metal_resist/PF13801.1/0.019,Zip/PF02535.17/9.5 TRINITY_DN18619_c0_g1_i1:66-1127(+)
MAIFGRKDKNKDKEDHSASASASASSSHSHDIENIENMEGFQPEMFEGLDDQPNHHNHHHHHHHHHHRELTEDEKKVAITQLEKRLEDVRHLDKENFVNEHTLNMFLRARNWDVDAATKMMSNTIKWRAEKDPSNLDCRWCLERPGHHTWRQVGFDKLNRPVVYSCFAQNPTAHYTPEDSTTHLIYAIENAVKTMKQPEVESWVWILDFTGFGLRACNPQLAKATNDVLANHYPERLGMLLAVNPPSVFHYFWKAISRFIDPKTGGKIRFLHGAKTEDLAEIFDTELTQWLMKEIKENKGLPKNKKQLEFWKKPSNASDHDPRGCESYIKAYIDIEHPPENGHRVHPNIRLPK